MDYMPPCTDRKLMKQTAEHHKTLQLFDNASIPAYAHETLLFRKKGTKINFSFLLQRL